MFLEPAKQRRLHGVVATRTKVFLRFLKPLQTTQPIDFERPIVISRLLLSDF